MPDLNGLNIMMPQSVDTTGAGASATISSSGLVTFENCQTISLNGVFNSWYDNYMIVINIKEGSRDASTSVAHIAFRFRTTQPGAADNTSATAYTHQRVSSSSTTISGSRQSSDYGFWGNGGSDSYDGSIGYVFSPFLSEPTLWRTRCIYGTNLATDNSYVGTHNESVSFAGITFFRDTFVYFGNLAIYGFTK
jgi:hypothetical protein